MPVWFTQFYFLMSAFIFVLLLNKEKLEALEDKYDKRKAEKKARAKNR